MDLILITVELPSLHSLSICYLCHNFPNKEVQNYFPIGAVPGALLFLLWFQRSPFTQTLFQVIMSRNCLFRCFREVIGLPDGMHKVKLLNELFKGVSAFLCRAAQVK